MKLPVEMFESRYRTMCCSQTTQYRMVDAITSAIFKLQPEMQNPFSKEFEYLEFICLTFSKRLLIFVFLSYRIWGSFWSIYNLLVWFNASILSLLILAGLNFMQFYLFGKSELKGTGRILLDGEWPHSIHLTTLIFRECIHLHFNSHQTLLPHLLNYTYGSGSFRHISKNYSLSSILNTFELFLRS